jgi:shikimate dehydrogenase
VKLALIGNPVEHSQSPAIQRRFLAAAGISGDYELLRVERGRAAAALSALRAEGYSGCNVTFPLKEEVVALCDVLSSTAQRARAVNTIAFRAHVAGTCTDGIGAARALASLIGPLEHRIVVVWGTGPTARSVICALQEDGARVFVWGRDSAKVSAICSGLGIEAWAPADPKPAAVFSALLPRVVLPARIVSAAASAEAIMDANYGERSTLATDLGLPVVDGMRMLEEQARASFEFWLQRS